MNADLEKLTKLMPPLADAPDRDVNWDFVERSLGIVYPPDFKEFVGVYGGCTWCDHVSPIYCMGKSTEDIAEFQEFLAKIFGFFDGNTYNGEGEEVEYPLYPDEGGVIPFLASQSGGYYCWLPEGAPATWPILAWVRGGTQVLGDINMTQMFLEWLERKPRMIEMWGEFFLRPENFGLDY